MKTAVDGHQHEPGVTDRITQRTCHIYAHCHCKFLTYVIPA